MEIFYVVEKLINYSIMIMEHNVSVTFVTENYCSGHYHERELMMPTYTASSWNLSGRVHN